MNFPKPIFRFLLPGALILAAMTLPASAAQTNLVQNGDFEDLQNDQAKNWSFSSANPEIFKLSFPTEKTRGHIAQMDVSSAVMSGYFNQSIAVQPHTDYRFSALTRLSGGKILIYLHGGQDKTSLDTRIYVESLQGNPLVPLFWDRKWIQGSASTPNPGKGLVRTFLADVGVWQPVALDFNSGELSSVTVSLGAYFESGQYAFDDVSIVALPATSDPQK
jgi:hypothetical protein